MSLNRFDICPTYIRKECILGNRCKICKNDEHIDDDSSKEPIPHRVCEHCPTHIKNIFKKEFEFITPIKVASEL
jgi:hypothetical protein